MILLGWRGVSKRSPKSESTVCMVPVIHLYQTSLARGGVLVYCSLGVNLLLGKALKANLGHTHVVDSYDNETDNGCGMTL